MFCHPNCFKKALDAGLNLNKLRQEIVSGNITVCRDGLDWCNREFEKTQIKKLPRKYGFTFDAQTVGLGSILIKKYKEIPPGTIEGEDAGIFNYFAKCNIEGLDLVYQYPIRIVSINIKRLSQLSGVNMIAPQTFALQV